MVGCALGVRPPDVKRGTSAGATLAGATLAGATLVGETRAKGHNTKHFFRVWGWAEAPQGNAPYG